MCLENKSPANAPMRHRKLRVAWSVVWGVVAVLLVVLWVRSYWQADAFGFYSDTRSRVLEALSFGGSIRLERFDTSGEGGMMSEMAGGQLKQGFDLRTSPTRSSLPSWQFRSVTTPVRATWVVF